MVLVDGYFHFQGFLSRVSCPGFCLFFSLCFAAPTNIFDYFARLACGRVYHYIIRHGRIFLALRQPMVSPASTFSDQSI